MRVDVNPSGFRLLRLALSNVNLLVTHIKQ